MLCANHIHNNNDPATLEAPNHPLIPREIPHFHNNHHADDFLRRRTFPRLPTSFRASRRRVTPPQRWLAAASATLAEMVAEVALVGGGRAAVAVEAAAAAVR